MEGLRMKHPAYAQIGAYRVQGHATLYGSEFNHQHYVCVRIKRSEHIRTLSNDWHMGRGELIEVAMSEAQWASLVSGMNIGDGPCCTLLHIAHEQVPQLPDPKQTTEHFRKEIAAVYLEAKKALESIADRLGDGVGKRAAAELAREIRMHAHRIVGSSGFVADQFDEHMERTTEKAKIEVNAFVEAAINRAGLQAIANGASVLSLPDNKAAQEQTP
jgi:hypothetical protein